MGRSDQLSSSLREQLLGKGFTDAETDGAVTRLQELGFLNDGRVSAHWARRASESLVNGRLRVVALLVRKGVEQERAERLAAAALPEHDELNRALLIARKRQAKGNTIEQAARYLGARGFEQETVEQAIESVYDL